MTSPLKDNPDKANRGSAPRANRKRSRTNGDSSSVVAASSPMPSSPPDFIAQGGDDDEDIEEDAEIQDDIDELDEMAEDDVDLFREGFEQDYRDRESDAYEGVDIDDEGDFDAMNLGDRRRLEAQLNRRDREVARRQRVPTAFLPGEDEDGDIDLTAQPRRKRHHYDEDPDDEEGDIMEDELNLEGLQDVKAESLAEWVTQPAIQRSIKREFKSFLTGLTDKKGRSIYGERLRTLGEINAETLEVSYDHLAEESAILAYFLANVPAETLQLFDEIAMECVLLHYPDYERIHTEIHVRITDLPVRYTLRQLRQSHLNCLVTVSGVVTRRTGVFPQLKYIKFDCTKCGVTLGPFQQESNVEVKLGYCSNCQSRGPFTLNSEKTVYRNYQKVTLQESPGTVPAGRLPRHREVILLWDLIDKAKPGDEIEVTGIYRNSYDAQLNNRNGFPVFATILEANNLIKSHDQLSGFKLTEEDEREIRKLSQDPNVIEKIINSIAPGIYGHTDIKTGIALSLFGGVAKTTKGAHHVRGDINVLLLGDPGTAKSQFLKYVEKTAHRAVFATGQGASAVGLTASVRRDPLTAEWTLEGGALVLADKGTCLIDEFDKMNDQDRTSIHEAMEQQTISISKAGIVTTLQARCGIIAAANPIGGRYNSTIPFSANVELTEPILSRFDILCVVRDTVEPEEDERLARFVVGSHSRSVAALAQQHAGLPPATQEAGPSSLQVEGGQTQTQPAAQPAEATQQPEGPRLEGEIPQELLRKYILYARERCEPKLYNMDEEKIARLFGDMRKESKTTGAYPITVRHLEAIIRISEAFCRMRLSEYCTSADMDRAIAVTVDSFVGSQKLSAKKALARAFAKYTLARPRTGNWPRQPQGRNRAPAARMT